MCYLLFLLSSYTQYDSGLFWLIIEYFHVCATYYAMFSYYVLNSFADYVQCKCYVDNTGMGTFSVYYKGWVWPLAPYRTRKSIGLIIRPVGSCRNFCGFPLITRVSIFAFSHFLIKSIALHSLLWLNFIAKNNKLAENFLFWISGCKI